MLQKQAIPINFSKGLDLKTDPFQVQLGNFLSLENSIFTKGGLLQKRNGYEQLASLPDQTFTYTTTFSNNLLAIGSEISSYNQGTNSWTTGKPIQPVQLSTLPLIRSSLNQTQCDSVLASNGLVCTVFTDVGGTTTPQYKYRVDDSATGQSVVLPTTLPNGAGVVTGSPRVFLLGGYFVIVFSNNFSGTYHLQYIALTVSSPSTVTTAADLTTAYTPADTVAWDGVVANNRLFIAWNGNDMGGAIHMTFLSSALAQGNTVDYAGRVATIMSVCADITQGNPVIYAPFYDSGSSTGYILAVNTDLTAVLAPTEWLTTGTILNVTAVAQNMVATIYYEVSNTYTYDTNIATNFIRYRTCTQAGSLGSATVLLRSVGIASKAFLIDGIEYLLAVYDGKSSSAIAYQPTFFLIDSSGRCLAKLAYANGGGYLTLGLPSVSIYGTTASVAYLIRDLVEPVNKTQGALNAGLPVYSQTGVNIANFDLTTNGLNTVEIGQALHVSGGFMWMYDGSVPVEHDFHLWPDSVEISGSATPGNMEARQYFYVATYEWSDDNGNVHRSAPSIPVSFTITTPTTFTADTTNTSPVLHNVSSLANLQVGQHITGTGIPTNTHILSIDGATQITMDKNATASNSNVTITASAVTSASINVPTERITYKTTANGSTPITICVYRWSVGQQTFYKITSLTSPRLNDISIDYVTITDSAADSAIIGNAILYTTGGVVENIAAPAVKSLCLYKSRLFLIDAEDRNLLWFSKQVIETTPVEMSDLFTIFIAPTTGAQGSTGDLSCIFPMDDKLIIFKKDAIYYLTGTGPDNTGANNDFSDPIFITSTVGCDNQASIVLTPNGLMFQSDKGIWQLGRDLSTSYIGAPVEDFNQYAVNSANVIPGTNQVRFTLSNKTTLMYDYFYQQWGTFTGIAPISSTLYNSLHTFINAAGNLFQEKAGTYVDGLEPVLLSLQTSWINLAGLQGYQRAYFFYLLGTYLTPHKLVVEVAYDYNSNPSQLSLISPDNFNPVYGVDSPYGAGSPYGNNAALEQWRVFLSRQRCQAFQLTIREIYDPSKGVPAGAGLTLSGLNLVVALKKGFKPQSAANSIGG